MFLENPNDPSIISTLIVFAAQDDDISYLHDLLKTYDTYIESIKKKILGVPLPVRTSLIPKQNSEISSPLKSKIEKKTR